LAPCTRICLAWIVLPFGCTPLCSVQAPHLKRQSAPYVSPFDMLRARPGQVRSALCGSSQSVLTECCENPTIPEKNEIAATLRFPTLRSGQALPCMNAGQVRRPSRARNEAFCVFGGFVSQKQIVERVKTRWRNRP
jgi:hypothetical protein